MKKGVRKSILGCEHSMFDDMKDRNRMQKGE